MSIDVNAMLKKAFDASTGDLITRTCADVPSGLERPDAAGLIYDALKPHISRMIISAGRYSPEEAWRVIGYANTMAAEAGSYIDARFDHGGINFVSGFGRSAAHFRTDLKAAIFGMIDPAEDIYNTFPYEDVLATSVRATYDPEIKTIHAEFETRNITSELRKAVKKEIRKCSTKASSSARG